MRSFLVILMALLLTERWLGVDCNGGGGRGSSGGGWFSARKRIYVYRPRPSPGGLRDKEPNEYPSTNVYENRETSEELQARIDKLNQERDEFFTMIRDPDLYRKARLNFSIEHSLDTRSGPWGHLFPESNQTQDNLQGRGHFKTPKNNDFEPVGGWGLPSYGYGEKSQKGVGDGLTFEANGGSSANSLNIRVFTSNGWMYPQYGYRYTDVSRISDLNNNQTDEAVVDSKPSTTTAPPRFNLFSNSHRNMASIMDKTNKDIMSMNSMAELTGFMTNGLFMDSATPTTVATPQILGFRHIGTEDTLAPTVASMQPESSRHVETEDTAAPTVASLQHESSHHVETEHIAAPDVARPQSQGFRLNVTEDKAAPSVASLHKCHHIVVLFVLGWWLAV